MNGAKEPGRSVSLLLEIGASRPRGRPVLQLLCALLSLLSGAVAGCAPVGPLHRVGADQVLARDLGLADGEIVELYSAGALVSGVYGFQGFVLQGAAPGGVVLGALVCTSERLIFAAWDDDRETYVLAVAVPYRNIRAVEVKSFALTSRLVVEAGDQGFYTFEVTDSRTMIVDKSKTRELAAFLDSRKVPGP